MKEREIKLIRAYKQGGEGHIVGIQYYDELKRRCTLFVQTGSDNASEDLIKLINSTQLGLK